MSEELLPCPFCNQKPAIRYEEWSGDYKSSHPYNIDCCFDSFGWFDTEKGLIEAWNRRVKDD